MQTLVYEPSWEKQISLKDRKLVETTYTQTTWIEDSLQFKVLRTDINYKNELLVIVLIHNSTNQNISFHKKKLCLSHNHSLIGEHVFRLPNLNVKAKTSMPWTFIFPNDTYTWSAEIQLEELNLSEDVER